MIKANPRDFLFTRVKQSAPERNGFDLSHENKQTCKAGFIYPFELLEALPNDDFQIQTESFIRLMPMLSPTMHRLKAYWHWFFVPNRLTWNYWEEFISRGNGKKLSAGQEYTPPEPVTFTLYDMLYAMNYKAYDDVDYITNRVTNYMSSLGLEIGDFWAAGIDEQLNIVQSSFPEFIVRRLVDASNYSRFIFIQSTPRVATSMGIVDTMIPRGIIGVDNSEDEFVAVNYTIDGSTVNSFSYSPVVTILMGAELYWFQNHDHSRIIATQVMPNAANLIANFRSIKLSVMPLVAYMLIYNDYYRDENLIEELDEILDYFRESQGVLDMSNFVTKSYLSKLLEIHYRAWEKDYFTTATQMPQKAPDVLIPNIPTSVGSDGGLVLSGSPSSISSFNPYIYKGTGHPDGTVSYRQSNDVGYTPLSYSSGLKLNNQGQGTTVADIRRSFALQRWFEKAVRTGTRYIETLKAFFNSDAGDSRLQRPEYIGGTSMPIQISDTVQTSATADGSDTPQGNLAGYGVAADNSQILSYHAPEHGFVIGCFSILARTSYAQGIPKCFSRETWLDYAFPEFEHIGEQGIQNKELYAAPLTKDLLNGVRVNLDTQTLPSPNAFFGYQSRYAEYKQIQDRFGGGFARSLDFWSLGRIFDNPPTLSQQFVEANVSDRNFAVSRNSVENPDAPIKEDVQDVDTDQYVCDFWLDIKKVTSLTLYSEPI